MKEFVFTDGWYWFLIAAAVCYFIGCFNFAVLISHFKKKDIRDMGSGNPGTMNMTRSFGLKFGAINFFCDVIKGGVPALIAYFIFKDYVFS
ncbi:MAG: glycerol-3-phosphate acyltransferase [Clostridia bacterium]|nr:glycerol-3-phosphate acyltransferase [Clostridia bacterium]